MAGKFLRFCHFYAIIRLSTLAELRRKAPPGAVSVVGGLFLILSGCFIGAERICCYNEVNPPLGTTPKAPLDTDIRSREDFF